MTKLPQKRYHADIYFPDWTEKALEEFLISLENKKTLAFSVHAVIKIVQYSFDYGKQLLKYLLKSLTPSELHSSSIFEFYATGNRVNKACFRFTFESFPVDLVLVISSDGTVITVFTTNKGDNHASLNVSLYETKKL